MMKKMMTRKAIICIAVLIFLFLFRDWLVVIFTHSLVAVIAMLVYGEIRGRALYLRRVRYETEQL